MGFFNLCDNNFGSLGMRLDAPCTQLEIAKSESMQVDANLGENAVKIVENLVNSLKLQENFSLKVMQKIPEHAGLGSGTQMALALGAGLNQLYDLHLSVHKIAAYAQRGKRSGIGIAAFTQGGVLVDDGQIKADAAPTVMARAVFPEAWRVLLVQDSAHVGVHGAAEVNAFAELKPAQHNLRNMVLQHMLPALQRSDLLAFGAYMADLQAYNGDYFAPVQGGRYASKNVAEVLTWLQQNGAPCVGQSSWGPTGFAILGNQQQADALQSQAQLAFADKTNLSFSVCRGNNRGARIEES